MKIEELVKHFGGLASHFRKAAAHHEAIQKAHDAHAAVLKAKIDGMDNDHPDLALHKSAHAHHMCKAELHKAYAAHNGGMADGMSEAEKAAKAGTLASITDPPVVATPAVKCAHDLEMTKACKDCKREETKPVDVALAAASANMGAFMQEAISEGMKALKDDPEFKKKVRDALQRQLDDEFNKTAVPDKVHGAIKDNPDLTLVPRFGGPDPATIDKSKVPPELMHMVSRS